VADPTLVLYTTTIERPENPIYLGDELPNVQRVRVYHEDLPKEVQEYHPMRQAIYVMTHPHTLLPKHDVSMWIDGSESFRTDPRHFLQYVKDTDIALFRHWAEGSLYEEGMREWTMARTVPKEAVINQCQEYRGVGYPIDINMCLDVLVVRRDTPEMRLFNESWWDEYFRWHTRADMMSLMYLLWQTNTQYTVIPGNFWEHLTTWQQAKPGVRV
jgi:hypothetical protein